MKAYDRVLWITTSKRTDRQDSFLRNLHAISDVPIQRVTGFDAHALKIAEDYALGPFIGEAGRGIIGCYLSHILALRIAAMYPRENILILEDDVSLCDDFNLAVANELAGLKHWHVMMLVGTIREGASSHAYIVKSDAAADLASMMERNRRHGVGHFFQHHPSGGYPAIMWSRNECARQLKAAVGSTLIGDFRQRTSEQSFMERVSKTYSQYGEDNIIYEFFHGENPPDGNPMFLEIGALDGIKDSNCYKLATLGWVGVCIEPNPYHFIRLCRNYGGCERMSHICAAVGPDPSIRTLHLNNDGLSTTHPDVFCDLNQRIAYLGWCMTPTITPDQIVDHYGPIFDFVSVDAEGMDRDIVRASTRLLEHTRLICVETAMPGKPATDDDCHQWMEILVPMGFTNMIHQTAGNLLMARE